MKIRTVVIAERQVPELLENVTREAVKVEDVTGEMKEIIKQHVKKHVFLEEDLEITVKIEILEEGE